VIGARATCPVNVNRNTVSGTTLKSELGRGWCVVTGVLLTNMPAPRNPFNNDYNCARYPPLRLEGSFATLPPAPAS